MLSWELVVWLVGVGVSIAVLLILERRLKKTQVPMRRWVLGAGSVWNGFALGLLLIVGGVFFWYPPPSIEDLPEPTWTVADARAAAAARRSASTLESIRSGKSVSEFIEAHPELNRYSHRDHVQADFVPLPQGYLHFPTRINKAVTPQELGAWIDDNGVGLNLLLDEPINRAWLEAIDAELPHLGCPAWEPFVAGRTTLSDTNQVGWDQTIMRRVMRLLVARGMLSSAAGEMEDGSKDFDRAGALIDQVREEIAGCEDGLNGVAFGAQLEDLRRLQIMALLSEFAGGKMLLRSTESFRAGTAVELCGVALKRSYVEVRLSFESLIKTQASEVPLPFRGWLLHGKQTSNEIERVYAAAWQALKDGGTVPKPQYPILRLHKNKISILGPLSMVEGDLRTISECGHKATLARAVVSRAVS